MLMGVRPSCFTVEHPESAARSPPGLPLGNLAMNRSRFRITILSTLVLVACAGSQFRRVSGSPHPRPADRDRRPGWELSRFRHQRHPSQRGQAAVGFGLAQDSRGSILLVVAFEAISIAFGTAIYAILSAKVPPWHRHATLERVITHLSLIALSMTLGTYAAFRLYPRLWPLWWTRRRLRDQATSATVAGDSSVDLERSPPRSNVSIDSGG